MFNLLMFHSSTDDLYISYFLLGISCFFGLYYCVEKWKKTQNDASIFEYNKTQNLNHYTLNFNTEGVEGKKVSKLTKLILFSFCIVLIVTPFYEFVETLRPEQVNYYFSCLGINT
ncbi:hypothetical protein [Lacinutrix salivirga]